MDDTLVKSWALWGEYLEAAFTREPAVLATGVSAITCFLHACRHQKENKSRKYLSKVGAPHRRGGGVDWPLDWQGKEPREKSQPADTAGWLV